MQTYKSKLHKITNDLCPVIQRKKEIYLPTFPVVFTRSVKVFKGTVTLSHNAR